MDLGMFGDLNTLLQSIGLVGICAIIFVESGFPFGFFLPGDTLLFTAGLLAAQGHFNIALAIVLIFASSVAGVTIGYFSGKQLGKRFIKQEGGLLFRHEYVEKATAFYDKHGGKAIILGRFVPAVRSFVPIVAGVAKMPYHKLMFYNTIGALIWATLIPLIGFYAGGWLEQRGVSVDAFILPIIGAIIIISLLGPVAHALRDPKTRAKLLSFLNRSH